MLSMACESLVAQEFVVVMCDILCIVYIYIVIVIACVFAILYCCFLACKEGRLSQKVHGG